MSLDQGRPLHTTEHIKFPLPTHPLYTAMQKDFFLYSYFTKERSMIFMKGICAFKLFSFLSFFSHFSKQGQFSITCGGIQKRSMELKRCC